MVLNWTGPVDGPDLGIDGGFVWVNACSAIYEQLDDLGLDHEAKVALSVKIGRALFPGAAPREADPLRCGHCGERWCSGGCASTG